jgi:hypothetical protein
VLVLDGLVDVHVDDAGIGEQRGQVSAQRHHTPPPKISFSGVVVLSDAVVAQERRDA